MQGESDSELSDFDNEQMS